MIFDLLQKGSSKFLLDRLLPLLKEMRFIIKKTLSNVLLFYVISQICINFFYIFFTAKYKNEWKEHKLSKQKKINKSNFYKNKKLFNIHDLDANKILVSKKESYGTKNSFKYFVGYNDDDAIRPLCIKLPQMIGYAKNFDDNKTYVL